MYKNILLPLDGSKIAEQSIPTAIHLAKIFNAKITLIQIAEIIPVLKEDREAESKILQDRAKKYLNEIKQKFEENGVSADVVVKTGKPDFEICEYTKRGNVDLLIMSTHGVGGITRWALGSVSDKVMRHSTKPVLLLRPALTDPLEGKVILAVDDEPDVLETIEEQLDTCQVYKASDYHSALQYIQNQTFDLVILDIMGVNGFELLKESVSRKFPTVILTAHALTPEALEKSMKLGAVFFLPKDRLYDLNDFLAEVVKGEGKSIWKKLFDRLGPYFRKRFGPNWREKEATLLKEIEKFL